jgi:AAA domain, putative AbiEii toxin, Type IV TA system
VPTTEPARPSPFLRIDELAITNFRTFRARTVIPFRGPTGELDAVAVFHGDNGSGKSNAMVALDLFFQTASLVLERGNDEGEIVVPWDVNTNGTFARPLVLAYQDRPHGSEGAMEIEISFVDARLGRIRSVCTPSGDQVRVQLERTSRMPSASSTEDGILFSAVSRDERHQLKTWLLTPHGPGSVPLTILDARRRAQWNLAQGHRSLLPPELSEQLLGLRTSRRPEHRDLWRQFVELLHRFEAFRGKDVSVERPSPKPNFTASGSTVAPELVVEERGRIVLGLDELSSGEQQVIVLAAASLLAGSGILAIQEPEISLDVKNQRLFRKILADVAARGPADQVLLESHVPTFDGAEVIRFARRADGTSEVRRAAAVDEQRREIALKAKEQGAEQRWITRDGYTQVPDNMRSALRLENGGHVWFVKGIKHWEAWPEADLDDLFGVGDEEARDG